MLRRAPLTSPPHAKRQDLGFAMKHPEPMDAIPDRSATNVGSGLVASLFR